MLKPPATAAGGLDAPLVSIVVPTFHRPRVLERTLRALLDLSYPKHRYEILVVDDGDDAETAGVVAGLPADQPRLRYYWQGRRGGAAARNLGARHAEGEILLFTDDDAILMPEVVEQHLDALRRFGDCLVNGRWEFEPELAAAMEETPFGRYRIKTEAWVAEDHDAFYRKPLFGPYMEQTGITACDMAVRRDTFFRIGGFDEEFPYVGCEDQEFGLRVIAAGYPCIFNSTLQFWHNDHRLTLRQFGERQCRGAVTKVLLARKHPAQYGLDPMIVENRPWQRGDPPRAIVRKLAKRILSAAPFFAGIQAMIMVLERWGPDSRVLYRLYWMVCGLYIFRGIREGYARYGGPTAPHAGGPTRSDASGATPQTASRGPGRGDASTVAPARPGETPSSPTRRWEP